MPLINVQPKEFQNGDKVTVYTNTVGPQSETFTFLTEQEHIVLRNTGTKAITYIIGTQQGSLGPSQRVEVKETVSSITLQSEVGTQAFDLWADEVGTSGVSDAAIASLDAKVNDVKSQLAQTVKKVNGAAPDAEGNITIDVPEVDTTNLATKTELNALGQVKFIGVYATLTALQTAFPTGTNGIALVTADGYGYYWNGTAWTKGAVFQATGLSTGSITELTLTDEMKKWLSKENLFSCNRRKWQYGVSAIPDPSPVTRISTPVVDRVFVSYTKHVTLYFTDATKKIAITQFDSAGTQTNYSGWLNANTVNIINILANTEKIGFTGAYTTDTTINLDAFENNEVLCVAGESVPLYKKSLHDEKENGKIDTFALTKQITLNNLFVKDPNKYVFGTLAGNKSTKISNNTANTLRLSSNVTYPGVDVSKVSKVYLKNLSNFDITIVEVDANGFLLKDSYWLTTEEYTLQTTTTQIYFTLKHKANNAVYPSEVRNIQIYVGFSPYDENVTGLSELQNVMNNKLNPMFVPTKTRFIAHRGFSSRAPENSLAAFELAGQNGFWGIEADVNITSDNVPIIMHDDSVDRTTNGTGNVRDLTLAYIQGLTIDTGSGITEYPNEKVPTFADYLKVCRKYGAVPVVEIKGSNLTNSHLDIIMNTLIDYGFEETGILMSFNTLYVDYIRSKNKRIHVQILLNVESKNIEIVQLFGNASINSGNVANMEELIKLAHRNGVLVNVNTIDDPTIKGQLMSYGVDMITTNVFTS